jgi:ferrous iron transport protein A
LKLSLNSVCCLAVPKIVKDSCPQRVALSDLPEGASGRVTELNGQPDSSQRLREMGFCESAVVQKIAGEHLMICELCGTRVALRGDTARNIVVELIDRGPGGAPPR